MDAFLKNNYQHHHINYNHTIYSKEVGCPSQFYHTHTELDDTTSTLIHHHHIYHVEYLNKEGLERPKSCEPILESSIKKTNTLDKCESIEISDAAESLLELKNSLDK